MRWAIFCPFTPPPNNMENQNLEKMEKASGYVIILHICTRNHVMYAYCDMECE